MNELVFDNTQGNPKTIHLYSFKEDSNVAYTCQRSKVHSLKRQDKDNSFIHIKLTA